MESNATKIRYNQKRYNGQNWNQLNIWLRPIRDFCSEQSAEIGFYILFCL